MIEWTSYATQLNIAYCSIARDGGEAHLHSFTLMIMASAQGQLMATLEAGTIGILALLMKRIEVVVSGANIEESH